jgi:glycosyltransferase involved in cell wall biosynthesis
MSAAGRPRILLVHGVPAGAGGLGTHVEQVLRALAPESVLLAAGPRGEAKAPPGAVTFHAPAPVPAWASRLTPLRWYQGASQLISDRSVGAWAARLAAGERPERVYTFTQVGLEVLRWARANGVPSVLDNPNGHIADHRAVCAAESETWCRSPYRGHPARAMIERVEQEYALADRIRVASDWAKASMVERGVPAGSIEVVPLAIDTRKYHPVERPGEATGRFRVAFTSALSLGKGFVYLLRAMQAAGRDRFTLLLCGSTGDRCSRQLFQREAVGIQVVTASHPHHAYEQAELAVLPTLHDGFGFVVAEAMASGIPVVVSDRCGAADWMREVEPRWIVPARDKEALARVLIDALARRADLPKMGRAARVVAERRGSQANLERLASWALERRIS